VFPTAGRANPTLMIVALAIRLADHLKQQFYSSRDHGAFRPPRHEPEASLAAAAPSTLVLSAPASAIVRSGNSGKAAQTGSMIPSGNTGCMGKCWALLHANDRAINGPRATYPGIVGP
jgi:hypothetical protein